MRRSNFALHIPPTLFAEARKVAESEGVALNQLITVPNENALWPGTNGFPDKHPHAVFDRGCSPQRAGWRSTHGSGLRDQI
jgi:hypothetical protein